MEYWAQLADMQDESNLDVVLARTGLSYESSTTSSGKLQGRSGRVTRDFRITERGPCFSPSMSVHTGEFVSFVRETFIEIWMLRYVTDHDPDDIVARRQLWSPFEEERDRDMETVAELDRRAQEFADEVSPSVHKGLTGLS